MIDVEEQMTLVNQYLKETLLSDNPDMQDVMDDILATQGKQLRPRLAIISAGFGNNQTTETALIACFLEIIHMASLVHDDVIDDSDMRRGNLSIQKKYGKKMAVYAGDYMIFCIVNRLIDVNPTKYREIITLMRKMCNGELGQNSSLHDLNITEEKYIQNITGKTAALFEIACKIGAKSASVSKYYIDALANFGRNFGILFQIRDDMMDYTSSREELGKPIFQDFANGIYTLPVIYSYSIQENKTRLEQLKNLVHEHGMTENEKNMLFDIIIASKGLEKCREKAREYYDSAVSALNVLPDTKEKKYLSHMLEKVYSDIQC